MSALKDVRDALVKYAKLARNGKYFVKRGAMVWAAFDFSRHERAVAIMFDDLTILRQDKPNDAKVAIEMFCRMPKDTDDPEIDDGLLDELIEDAEWVLVKAMSETSKGSGDNVILRLDAESANVVEAHDVSKRVQGIVVTFNVSY